MTGPGRAALALIAASALGSAASAQAPAPELAITVDDLPVHGALPPGETREQIARSLVSALQAGGAPPTWGFVNGVGLEREPDSAAVLKIWRAAGYPLGNHTYTHLSLDAVSLPQWEADVEKNRPVLETAMAGRDWRWLRFPYLNEGATPDKRSGARAYLASQGYRIAAVTMSFGDYAFNEAYVRCLTKGDAAEAERIETAYLAAAQTEASRARAMSQTLLGRDIPYVLLMHIGALEAHLAPQLLAQYRAEGFHLVSLEQAEADPFYASSLRPGGPDAPDSLEAGLRAKGQPVPAGVALGDLSGMCR